MKEIEDINLLVANDIDPAATELMQKNFDFNGLNKDKY
jgi:tRNA G37 N-methylase Trm5